MTDPLIVMQNDLEKALLKGESGRKWAMLIDLRKCVGCHACTVGCMSENVTPPAMHYRPVYESESGTYPNVKRTWTPRPCMQCDNPACVPVCPADATKKETKGDFAGIVVIDYEKCIGCGECVPACPYKARKIDEGDNFTSSTHNPQKYEKRKFFEYGSTWQRIDEQPPINKARKCHFCTSRIVNKALPICVTTCIGRATYFGDLNDEKSLISQIFKSNKTVVAGSVKETDGKSAVVFEKNPKTQPRVYYIVQG